MQHLNSALGRRSLLLPAQSWRAFSSNNRGGDDEGGYISDEDGQEFESDRRFSNFILFAGFLSLGGLLMASNVI